MVGDPTDEVDDDEVSGKKPLRISPQKNEKATFLLDLAL